MKWSWVDHRRQKSLYFETIIEEEGLEREDLTKFPHRFALKILLLGTTKLLKATQWSSIYLTALTSLPPESSQTQTEPSRVLKSVWNWTKSHVTDKTPSINNDYNHPGTGIVLQVLHHPMWPLHPDYCLSSWELNSLINQSSENIFIFSMNLLVSLQLIALSLNNWRGWGVLACLVHSKPNRGYFYSLCEPFFKVIEV